MSLHHPLLVVDVVKGGVGGLLLLQQRDLIGLSLFPWVQWGRPGSPTPESCHRESYSRSGSHQTGAEIPFQCALAAEYNTNKQTNTMMMRWPLLIIYMTLYPMHLALMNLLLKSVGKGCPLGCADLRLPESPTP